MSEWIVIKNGEFIKDDLLNANVITAKDIVSKTEYLQKTGSGLESLQLEIENDFKVEDLLPFLDNLRAIIIKFPKVNDGRGYSLARRLRDLGYKYTIRAQGHIVVDHYRHATQCGFDQIAISKSLAMRIPEEYWKDQIKFSMPNYQENLKAKN
jgi:uncharacterized protein (DUF934 family)